MGLTLTLPALQQQCILLQGMQGLRFRRIVRHRDRRPALKIGANLADKRLVMPHGQRNGAKGTQQQHHHHPAFGLTALQRGGIRCQQREDRIGKVPVAFIRTDAVRWGDTGLAKQPLRPQRRRGGTDLPKAQGDREKTDRRTQAFGFLQFIQYQLVQHRSGLSEERLYRGRQCCSLPLTEGNGRPTVAAHQGSIAPHHNPRRFRATELCIQDHRYGVARQATKLFYLQAHGFQGRAHQRFVFVTIREAAEHDRKLPGHRRAAGQ
ncbi:hypothetical protein D3C80_1260750 [compost metagenome]